MVLDVGYPHEVTSADVIRRPQGWVQEPSEPGGYYPYRGNDGVHDGWVRAPIEWTEPEHRQPPPAPEFDRSLRVSPKTLLQGERVVAQRVAYVSDGPRSGELVEVLPPGLLLRGTVLHVTDTAVFVRQDNATSGGFSVDAHLPVDVFTDNELGTRARYVFYRAHSVEPF